MYRARDTRLERDVALKVVGGPPRRRSRGPSPLRARGEDRGPAHAPQRLHALRRGQRGRRRLLRHGAPRGGDARGAHRPRPAPRVGGAPHRLRSRAGARARTRARVRPPRPQAPERLPDAATGAKILDFGLARTAPGAARRGHLRRRHGLRGDRRRVRRGHHRLHVARAGARRAGRADVRRLVLRLRALRDALGPPRVRRPERDGDARRRPRGRARLAVLSARRLPRPAGPRCPLSREGPREPAEGCRRGGLGARERIRPRHDARVRRPASVAPPHLTPTPACRGGSVLAAAAGRGSAAPPAPFRADRLPRRPSLLAPPGATPRSPTCARRCPTR